MKRDPATQHKAARMLGVMDADGTLPPDEVAKTMDAIVKAARAAAPEVDASGLQARLAWSAHDAKHHRTLQRDNVRTAILWATRDMIAAHAPPAAIKEAAMKAVDGILPERAVMSILAEEWNRQHGRRRR